VDNLARTLHAYLVVGTVAHNVAEEPLNSAVLISPDGARISRYDKVNLVPFGEFVPWPFGALTNKISTEAGDFAAGTRVVVSQAGAHKIGTFICYESVFPGYVRRFAANGADVLINISNDGWFGQSAAREQHLSMVRMRAAENRRWILRSTNDGITAAIDSAGRLRAVAPAYADAALNRLRLYGNALHAFWRLVPAALCGAGDPVSGGGEGGIGASFAQGVVAQRANSGNWSMPDGPGAHGEAIGFSGNGSRRAGPVGPSLPGRSSGRQRSHLRVRDRDAAEDLHLHAGPGLPACRGSGPMRAHDFDHVRTAASRVRARPNPLVRTRLEAAAVPRGDVGGGGAGRVGAAPPIQSAPRGSRADGRPEAHSTAAADSPLERAVCPTAFVRGRETIE
jgi:hypothetical protein